MTKGTKCPHKTVTAMAHCEQSAAHNTNNQVVKCSGSFQFKIQAPEY